ncbi:MAG TPA: serine protease [Pseudobdellovibrionaceae bacterium]|nr:serine protease [Pseudobdellovibrionaceae bacterium]
MFLVQMFLVRWIILGLISTSLIACQKEETTKINYVEREKKVILNPWGKFEYKSISPSDTSLKMAADATAFIKSTSSSGSGFFISHQGQVLLITNEHVLGRSRCTVHGCVGVIVVRGFYPGGPNQKIESLKPIIMSSDSDFSIFQTSLNVKDTPALEVGKLEEDLKLKMEILTLGHPASSTTKSSQLTVQSISPSTISANGGIWKGNSGGPVIDPKSLKVYGITSAYLYPTALSKDGFFENDFTPEIIRLDFVLHILNNYSKFSKLDQVQLLPPQTIQDMPHDKKWFESIGWRLKDPLKSINDAFYRKNDSSNLERVEMILKSYRRIYLATGQRVLLSPTVAEGLNKILIESEFYPALPQDNIENHQKKVQSLLNQIKALSSNLEPLDSCITKVEQLLQVNQAISNSNKITLFYDKISFDKFNFFPLCLNTKTIDPTDFLKKYKESISKLPIDTQEDIFNYIEQYIDFKYTSPREAKETYSLLESFAKTSDSLDAGFAAEGLIHIINEIPDMAGLGWLNKVSERQFQVQPIQ